MNIAVNTPFFCLEQLNSFGVKVADIAINAALKAKLDDQFEFCVDLKVTIYLTDFASGMQFVIDRTGYRPLIKMIEFQGPLLPIVEKPKSIARIEPSPIYRSGRRFQGD